MEDYRPDLDSEVADINHSGTEKRCRLDHGSLVPARVRRRPPAHLDIAGTGRSDVDRGLLSKGATGFGARLLLTWLEDMA